MNRKFIFSPESSSTGHKELQRSWSKGEVRSWNTKNSEKVSISNNLHNDNSDISKSAEKLRISSISVLPKVKPTVPIRPYSQRDCPLIEEDCNSHPKVFKSLSYHSESASGNEGQTKVNSDANQITSRINNFLVRQGPRPYQNPRLAPVSNSR